MIKTGTSGFSFDDWKGSIYPPDLKKNSWLVFYERELGFKALEVNFTYYSLPSPKSFDSMSRKTSEDFEFAVKAYKDMTHNIRDKATKKIVDNSEVFKNSYFPSVRLSGTESFPVFSCSFHTPFTPPVRT